MWDGFDNSILSYLETEKEARLEGEHHRGCEILYRPFPRKYPTSGNSLNEVRIRMRTHLLNPKP